MTTKSVNTVDPSAPPQLFIDGEFRVADKSEPVLEAATGELLGEGASASRADIDAAVAAARSALPEWASASPDHRAKMLKAFAGALHKRAETTNELVTRENGMPMSLSRSANGLFPAALLGYYARLITETPIEEIRPSATGHTIVRRNPVGVVAAIVPWNYPQALAAFKLAPALAAGCTVVLKASPETALDALVFAEAAREAGLPSGVLNVVPGGAEAGAHLVSHPGVDKVSFTGS
ncbi:MAG: aldehyde dehydrogenase family protein, partial [Mycobacterium sp.]